MAFDPYNNPGLGTSPQPTGMPTMPQSGPNTTGMAQMQAPGGDMRGIMDILRLLGNAGGGGAGQPRQPTTGTSMPGAQGAYQPAQQGGGMAPPLSPSGQAGQKPGAGDVLTKGPYPDMGMYSQSANSVGQRPFNPYTPGGF